MSLSYPGSDPVLAGRESLPWPLLAAGAHGSRVQWIFAGILAYGFPDGFRVNSARLMNDGPRQAQSPRSSSINH